MTSHSKHLLFIELRHALFALQTSVLSEKAEREAAKPNNGDIAHGAETDGAHRKHHAEEDADTDGADKNVPHSSPSATSAQQESLQPASESTASEQQSATDQLNGTDANGISEEGHQSFMSQKETEVLEDSDGEKEDGCHFTKGAYFIGKAVWGKVSRSNRAAAL